MALDVAPWAGDRFYAIHAGLPGLGCLDHDKIRDPRAAYRRWCADRSNRLCRHPGRVKLPAVSDLHPERYAEVLDWAAPGIRVLIPINPSGWTIELIKKKSDQRGGVPRGPSSEPGSRRGLGSAARTPHNPTHFRR